MSFTVSSTSEERATPVVGISVGDPAGIGPELVAHALANAPSRVRLRVFGDRALLERAASVLGIALPWDSFTLDEVTHDVLPPSGVATSEGGRAQLAYLEAAIAAAKSGAVAALCTAPIHKAACKAAGLDFPGHTELLAARLAPDAASPLPVTMMLAGPRLRVALVTTHVALAAVPTLLASDNGDGIVRAIVQTVEGLERSFGVPRPRIAVAGLNPHAGEAGHFGDEEARFVSPAIERARVLVADRAVITGPAVPDVVFRNAVDGAYDAVVALYHDQGLIPAKLLDFDQTVNVTLGLPLLRTSPDHGVAYDIAGTGKARTESFMTALRLAAAAVRA
jgi:4-hydroxythreonine-4-phosphate dehydrogenase